MGFFQTVGSHERQPPDREAPHLAATVPPQSARVLHRATMAQTPRARHRTMVQRDGRNEDGVYNNPGWLGGKIF